ncbi:uncharacterized protein LOC143915086 [Arctopsyche grandis]|uniref:uncharacterized protein LOC143915086 n=1 Tax=Arctopsyche grandis TaxID=121162 RepID=UPI00406D7F5D
MLNSYNMRIDAKITNKSEICIKLIDNLEGSSYPFAHLLCEEIEGIKQSLQFTIDGVFPVETKQLLLSTIVKKRRELELCIRKAAQKSVLKLDSHSRLNETNPFLQTLSKLFNPSVAEVQCLEGYQHFFRQLIDNRKSELNMKSLVVQL